MERLEHHYQKSEKHRKSNKVRKFNHVPSFSLRVRERERERATKEIYLMYFQPEHL